MATTDNGQNEIINAWQSLIEQSVKANTAFLEESAKIFAALLSKKIETKDLLKINTEILNAAANNFIKLNITNTENLMNFGLNISRSFFSFTGAKNNADNNNSGPENEPAENQAEPTGSDAKNQINLSVKQGEQISTSFYLNSHNAFAQTGKFYYGNFIEEATGKKAGLSMLISPKEFMLEPGKSLKIDISIDATNNINPGKYQSTVRLEGMDNQEFDIVVDVIKNEAAVTKVSKRKPVIKKGVAKKDIKKTKARK
jgi:hypothetical protein